MQDMLMRKKIQWERSRRFALINENLAKLILCQEKYLFLIEANKTIDKITGPLIIKIRI